MRNTIFIVVVLFLFSCAFLSKLFIPHLSIIASQEIGVNDVWQQYYPFKQLYADSLKQGRIPVWSNKIAGGFPVLAEGQTGVFYLPNLILFRIFPAPLAFNLGFLLSFFICSLGMYAFLKKCRIHPVAAVSGAIAYAYGGFFVTHMSHYNLFQAATLAPWLLYSTLLIFSNSAFGSIIFAFVLSQQIFAGHMQITVITFVAVCILALVFLYRRQITFRHVFTIVVAGVSGVFLSLAQIIPTYEFTSLSYRAKGVSFIEIIAYKYPVKYLLTMLHPFVFGNPQLGTFPHFRDNGGALFWETSGYVGVLPVIASLAALFYPVKNMFKYTAICIITVAFIFMIGTQSPFYILLTFPPFSFFRFPMRFLVIFTMGIILLSSLALDYLLKKTEKKPFHLALLITLPIITSINTLGIWRNYHGIVPFSEFLAAPSTVQEVRSDTNNKIISLFSQISLYQEYFSKEPGRLTRMLKLRDSLPANLYAVYGVPSMEIYSSQQSKRSVDYRSLIGDMNAVDATDESQLSASAIKLLGIKGVNLILSPHELKTNNATVKLQSNRDLGFSYNGRNVHVFYYTLTDTLPQYNLFGSSKIIRTMPDFDNALKSETWNIHETVMVETKENLISNDKPLQSDVTVTAQSDTELTATVSASAPAIFVSTMNYYPGWKAKVDGKRMQVFPVNVLNMGFRVPAGVHSIELYFSPDIYKIGYVCSLIGYAVLLMVTGYKVMLKHIHQ